MNYTLEQEFPDKSLAFRTIFFDTFKINIIERYRNVKSPTVVYNHIVIKLRTLDDQIIKTKKETVSKKLAEEDYQTYSRLSQKLSPSRYRNAEKVQQEQEFVHYILLKVLENYDLASITQN